MTSSNAVLAIRPADTDDAADVARLAVLDSSDAPTGPLLLGIIDGRPLAALGLTSGAVVADPFAPTADLVALLRQRAARLAATTPGAHRPRRLGGLAERLRRGSPATA